MNKSSTGLFIIDVQEKLYPHVERPCEILANMQKIIKGSQILGLPIVVTEQYPQGLGPTIEAIKQLLPSNQAYLPKTTFSCYRDVGVKQYLAALPISQWILIGIEAHICVLQTAKALQQSGYDVIVLNDAISSRSVYDFSTAIAEMRDRQIRVSSVETILFELVADSKAPEFKKISALVKNY